MELLIDTADTEKIRKALDYYPVSGVTCNPTILRRTGSADFSRTVEEILGIIGERPLHVQVSAPDAAGMVREGKALTERFGKIYVKIPVDSEGVKAIRILSSSGTGVTATAIYTALQGILAMLSGASYLAVYCNRMESTGVDFANVISELRKAIKLHGAAGKCRVLGASFRNDRQIVSAITAGAEAVTVDPSLLDEALSSSLIEGAAETFRKDWMALYGEKRIDSLIQP